MYIFTFTGAIIAFLSFGLAGFVYFKKYDTTLARYFCWSTFFFGIWLIGNVNVDLAANYNFVLISNAILTLGVCLYTTFIVFFTDTFTNPNQPIAPTKKIYYYLASIIFTILAATKFAFYDLHFYTYKPTEEKLGIVWIFFLIFFLVAQIHSINKLVKHLKITTGKNKKQTYCIIWGITLAMVGGVFFNLILPLIGEMRYTSLGSQFGLFFVGFSSYAIFKHKFLDIKLIIQRSLIFSILLFIITGLYIAILIIILGLFKDSGKTSFVVSALITCFLGIFLTPKIEHYFRRLTDPLFFKNKYDYREASWALTLAAGGQIELKNLLVTCAQELKKIFKTKGVYFLTWPQNRVIGINEQDQIVDYTQIIPPETKQQIEQCWQRVAPPTLPPPAATDIQIESLRSLIQTIASQKFFLELAEPLVTDYHLVGIMTLDKKLSGDDFSDEDKKLIRTFKYQVAMAIGKSNLFQTVKDYSENLEKKVAIRTEEIKKIQETQSQALLDIAHELQTPLTIMRGELNLLNNPPKNNSAITRLENSIDRISRFIKDMLRLAKLDFTDQKQFELFDLSILIENLCDEFVIISNAAQINFKNKITPHLQIVGDRHKISELIINLVSNSIKYTANHREINLTLEEQGDQAVVTIQDTGIGIAPEEIPLLFQRFYRHRSQKSDSHGLGLAICKKIVDLHDGAIVIDSILGQGTTVKVFLPKEHRL